jgi:hypothetical protein
MLNLRKLLARQCQPRPTRPDSSTHKIRLDDAII